MARNPNAGREAPRRSWKAPSDDFAAVDPDDPKGKVERTTLKLHDDGPGRRPNGGKDIIDRAGMSKSMQKRIQRARAEGERTARQVQADREAEYQREISDLKRQMHGLVVGGKLSKEEAAHEAAMKALEEALERAHTDGNHTEIARITREMQEKVTAWESKKRELLAAPADDAQAQQRKAQSGPAPEGKAWIAANREWYGRPGYEAETAATNAIDERLLREGSDPNSEGHYRKIQRELRRRFRDVNVVSPYGDDPDDRRGRDNDDEDDERDDSRRSSARDDDRGDGKDRDDADELGDDDEDDDPPPSDRQRQKPAFMSFEDGGGRRDSDRVRVRDGKIVLSRSDKETMQRFGMDPDNDAHCRQWARTKRENAENEE